MMEVTHRLCHPERSEWISRWDLCLPFSSATGTHFCNRLCEIFRYAQNDIYLYSQSPLLREGLGEASSPYSAISTNICAVTTRRNIVSGYTVE